MKRNLMDELKEGICAFSTIQKYKKESEEIEQILGKALGYPWFKDDQCNFPNATEADGVCVAPNTAATLAMHAADKIKMLEIRELDKQGIIDEQREKLKAWGACADKLFSFAEIVREVEGNDVRNPHYYDSACKAIEQYKKLKDGN